MSITEARAELAGLQAENGRFLGLFEISDRKKQPTSEAPMLIRVMYDNGQFDFVNQHVLNALLEKERVVSFKRCSGWVVVGRDPLRNSPSTADFAGAERRTETSRK